MFSNPVFAHLWNRVTGTAGSEERLAQGRLPESDQQGPGSRRAQAGGVLVRQGLRRLFAQEIGTCHSSGEGKVGLCVGTGYCLLIVLRPPVQYARCLVESSRKNRGWWQACGCVSSAAELREHCLRQDQHGVVEGLINEGVCRLPITIVVDHDSREKLPAHGVYGTTKYHAIYDKNSIAGEKPRLRPSKQKKKSFHL